MADAKRLAALSMVPALAKEVADQIESGSAGGVESVNGATGVVTLDAADVGALPDDYTPPATTWASITGKPATFPATTPVATATALATSRTFSITGDITAPAVGFTGAGNVALAASLAAGVIVNADVNASAAIAGSKLALTGYTIGTAGALDPTDTVNAALGKLEARIAALETP